ncbi:MAG: T9SS type A sorting domain-containing protein [Flavobacteriales bacterium]|nr:T9SS type A sorting domain-containing protein [Flavobacteriales bacterium]
MAIDVDEDGLLAVGGHVSHPEWGPITQYPTVAPPGAFTRSDGGGFFLVFDEQYQIKWCTQWGQQAPETMIRDMRIAPAEEGVKHMWITGSTASWFTYPNSAPLDVVPPTGGQGFYQPTDPSQFSMFVAKLDITHTHQIELSTYWGSNSIDVAYALALHEDQLWVVGSTLASTLDPDKAPYPGGGNYHRIVTNGETEAVILCFRTDPWDLWYGTLYGGSDKDVILSVTSDGAGRIYMIGDSRSPTGTLGSGNPPAYFAMENHGIPWTRDAFLIGIQAPPGQAPHLFWRTAFGGAGTERGWGIAATSDEVFICGATASQRAWGAGPMDFPLVEYQPGIPLGYFQYVNNYGTGSNPFAPWYDMEYFLDFHPWMLAQPEGIPWGYDAFMASFDVSATVGIPPLNSLWDTAGLHAVLLDQNGLWQLDLPGQGPWNIALYDAGGRLVEQIHVQHPQPTISLVARASGIYAIRVLNNHGAVYSSKLFKP